VCTELEVAERQKPAPPPRHDQSGNTCSSLARALGNWGEVNLEDSGVRGTQPGAHRALPAAWTRD